jgi:hypothetical protein
MQFKKVNYLLNFTLFSHAATLLGQPYFTPAQEHKIKAIKRVMNNKPIVCFVRFILIEFLV